MASRVGPRTAAAACAVVLFAGCQQSGTETIVPEGAPLPDATQLAAATARPVRGIDEILSCAATIPGVVLNETPPYDVLSGTARVTSITYAVAGNATTGLRIAEFTSPQLAGAAVLDTARTGYVDWLAGSVRPSAAAASNPPGIPVAHADRLIVTTNPPADSTQPVVLPASLLSCVDPQLETAFASATGTRYLSSGGILSFRVQAELPASHEAVDEYDEMVGCLDDLDQGDGIHGVSKVSASDGSTTIGGWPRGVAAVSWDQDDRFMEETMIGFESTNERATARAASLAKLNDRGGSDIHARGRSVSFAEMPADGEPCLPE